MDERKIEIIIHATDEAACQRLIQSLETVVVPENFDAAIQPVTGEEKYFAYDTAMRSSDAKYKIYIDERAVVTNENFLIELLDIFRDERIGAVGTSGAIELSTHGVSLTSSKRTDENYRGEVEVADGFFFATQYDLPWRHDLFKDNFFGGQAQSVEFKRAGYKIFAGGDWILYDSENFSFNKASINKFLDEYSADLFPLVTILIPTFNRPKYFREALESVLNQTYRNIEVVISDDSTIDDTEHLIQDYLARDKRIKYFRNKGFTMQENWRFLRAYDNPAAEYVNWLMDDDLFMPPKIERMVEIYRNNPDVSLVTSAKNIIDAEGNVTGNTQYMFKENVKLEGDEAGRDLFYFDDYIGELTTCLLRKKFLRDNDIFSTWCQLLSQGNMAWLTDILSALRLHKGNDGKTNFTMSLMPLDYTKLFRKAVDKKVFFHKTKDFRGAILFLLDYSVNFLNKLNQADYYTENVAAIEKNIIELTQTLINDYKPSLSDEGHSEQEKSDEVQ